MKPGAWRLFRELYFRIFLSVLTVTAAMLMLQNSLNQLKLRSLAAEATSSRLQISAATIESAIVRAEALGLAMDEMVGLQDLLDRERSRDDSLAQIAIVSPIGLPVITSGAPVGSLEPMLRRILSGREKTALVDAGDQLFTGRVLLDSSDAVMGAIVLTTPTDKYLGRVENSFVQMNRSYLVIFGCVAAVLIPFILFQFKSVNAAFGALDPKNIGAPMPSPHTEAHDMHAAIEAGNARYAEAEAELNAILTEHKMTATATEVAGDDVQPQNDPQKTGHLGRGNA